VSDQTQQEQREQQAPPAAEPSQAGQQPPPEQQAEQPRERDLAAELAQMEDRYKRALADLDNFRKRTARDLERVVAERRDAVTLGWLEAVDAVERALRQQPENPLYEGLRAVLDQMESILARQGVQRIGTPGERFDPQRHEAIDMRETDEVPPQTVVDVARSGFATNDRVLRPAQVVVARAPRREA
jgi:molecular chaperone GrpE